MRTFFRIFAPWPLLSCEFKNSLHSIALIQKMAMQDEGSKVAHVGMGSLNQSGETPTRVDGCRRLGPRMGSERA